MDNSLDELIMPELDEQFLENSIEAEQERADIQSTVEAVEQQQLEQQVSDQAEQDQLDDPRNEPGGGGFKGAVKELSTIIPGGIQDTVSSIATFPERTADMLSGEMAREREETGTYKPEWDPTGSYDNPIITKTWWGSLARGVVHFGGLAVGTIAAIKASPFTVPAVIKGMKGYSLVRAAGIGAISDIVSKESDGHNALGMLKNRYGWIDTPLTTKDTDHPMWMKFKNVVEGMGIGLIFDGATILLGRGGKKVLNQVKARNQTAKDSTIKKALSELQQNEEWRAAKNAHSKDAWQGDTSSVDDPFIIWENQKKIRTNWGAEEGSSGNLLTAIQRERIAKNAGLTEEMVDQVMRGLMSNDKYQRILRGTKNSRKRLVEVFGDAIAAHQRITSGRNATELSAAEYLKEIFESWDVYDKGTPDQIQTLTSRNVVVADMVVGTLLQKVRDMGISGREIADFADLTDIDGPAQQIVDTMLVALTEVKRARIIKSSNFRELGAGQKRSFLQRNLSEQMRDTRESIISILDLAEGSDDGDLLMSLFEAFSSMQTVNSLDDFDKWARKMIKGGTIEGKRQTGALVRELQHMMIHSILSGPKTAIRAIMGTSTATFLRPFAQTLGGVVTLPFSGDRQTVKLGLAQLNAMMQAIPESFELFRTKLNSYWSGDISSVKSRFQEYTREDNNWEILRRWAEDSGRATDGDKAAFAMANMARNANNTRWFTYSTKIMAATDDSFRYIIGRAKMREKALLSAWDAQGRGVLTNPEITPGVIKAFEDNFHSQIFDAENNLIDEAAKYAANEATLTKPLQGFAAGLNQVFQENPWAKPFFLFARTGVNGLELTAKHTPGFNFLVKEFNDIAFAKPDDLSEVIQYGITNARELANAKAIQVGRLSMGASLISMASWAWLSGSLTGNGPIDRQKRQVWLDNKWYARSIRLGDVWVNYDSIEPFNMILSTVADIGDASQLMGSEWTEKNLLKMSLLVAQGVTSKSYLAGMQQFVDLFAGKPGQANRIVANIANNTVPLAGIRNELGKVFSPHARELSSGIMESIQNRNLFMEKLPGYDLPIKYDMLNGKPIRDWDPMTRLWNSTIPVNFNLDHSPGRQLLFNSGYDLRQSTYYAPGGVNLTDHPEIRSRFQKAIGEQRLELKLNKLARDKKIIASLREMMADIKAGRRGDYEARDYFHNRRIGQIMREARNSAWASIMNDFDIQELMQEQHKKKVTRLEKQLSSGTANIESVLNMYR